MKKTSLKKNIVANFAGQGWAFLVGMIAVPFYIRFLGIEGYGLIGFYMTLHATFNSFLDFGLSITINRELARYTALPDKIAQSRDLVRTVEIGYWIIGLMIGIGLSMSASFIANQWIQAENIPPSMVNNVVIIMGIVMFVQWPLTFYQGGLLGLQKMVLLNSLNIAFVTLRAVGAIILLWRFSPAVVVFFIWQAVVSVLQTGVTAILLWRGLPPSDHAPIFRIKILKDIWQFTAGMTAISFFNFFLQQADKVILSKLLNLEFFGYYSLATTLNGQFQLIGAQIIRPLFPQFAALIASNAVDELRNLYRKGCQLVSVVILPLTVIFAFFASRLIQIWTQDPTTAEMTAPIVAILFISTALYNLLEVQYILTTAYGWIRLGFFQQVISVVVLVPLMVIFSLRFGGVGAAFAKVILYLAYLVFIPPIVYRKFPVLEGKLKRFYIIDIGFPLLAILTVAGIGYWLIPPALPTIQFLVAMVLVSLMTYGAALLSAGEIRNWAFEQLGILCKRIYPI